jgi:hypothetical protein
MVALPADSPLKNAAAYPVVLVDRAVPAWWRPNLAGAITADLTHPGKVTTAVEQFTADHPVSGVVTYDHRARLAASLAHQLGLPRNVPETLAVCENPPRALSLLQEDGVPLPSSTVDDEDGAVAAVRALRLPAVLNAAAARGSHLRAENDSEVRAAYRTIMAGPLCRNAGARQHGAGPTTQRSQRPARPLGGHRKRSGGVHRVLRPDFPARSLQAFSASPLRSVRTDRVRGYFRFAESAARRLARRARNAKTFSGRTRR